MGGKLTPDELAHLKDLAVLLRAATPGLRFNAEMEDGWDERGDYWKQEYGQIKTGDGRIIGSLASSHHTDGQLFATAREELAWLLRLVARLTENVK